MRRKKGKEMPSKTCKPITQVVYGIDGADRLVVIPMERAEELARVRKARETCKTWNEFKKAVSKDSYKEALHWYGKPDSGDDPFEIAAFYDGSWPPSPLAELENWLPGKFLEKYATAEEAAIDQVWNELDPARMDEIVRELESLGYSLIRDDRLINLASGFHEGPEQ